MNYELLTGISINAMQMILFRFPWDLTHKQKTSQQRSQYTIKKSSSSVLEEGADGVNC